MIYENALQSYLNLKRRQVLLNCGSKAEATQAPHNHGPQRMYEKSFKHFLTMATEESEMSASVLQPLPSPGKQYLSQVTIVNND
jgi:hypothetical protein